MSLRYLITGGAGFIGSNYVARLIQRGDSVTIYDNLSRRGSRLNFEWLENTYGEASFKLINGDVRDMDLVSQAIKGVDVIVHLAAQVAVTTSVADPQDDFSINAQGTFNILEAARLSGDSPVILYASTNKVYGSMDDIPIIGNVSRFGYEDLPQGIPETQPLDFHSPYGCSKGAGDQYVHDYHRIYHLPTVVLRQSCIYGPRQFGMEDQGWVAWFIISAILGHPITIYGDGRQTRDILFVDDLLDAYDAAISSIDQTAGQIYNIGGGHRNTISIWEEFGRKLKDLLGQDIPVTYSDWRPGDQKVYISDIRKARHELRWLPRIGTDEGISRLAQWIQTNRQLFS